MADGEKDYIIKAISDQNMLINKKIFSHAHYVYNDLVDKCYSQT